MAKKCPNKNLKSWKILEKQVGETVAYKTWKLYGEEIPSTVRTLSQLRNEIGVPYEINDSNLPAIYKRIQIYNKKNGTSHTISHERIGQSGRLKIRLKPSYFPVNARKQELRKQSRDERNIQEVVEFTENNLETEIGNDFYMNDQALREQEERNLMLSPKEDVSEAFNDFPVLAEIGTEEQYSRYLDDIFPNSKEKGVLLLSTDLNLLKDTPKKIKSLIAKKRAFGGFLVSPNNTGHPFGEKSRYKDFKVLINPKGEFHENGSNGNGNGGYDIAVESRIHVLGSEQDISGFKEFVDNDIPSTPKRNLMLSPKEDVKDPNLKYIINRLQEQLERKENALKDAKFKKNQSLVNKIENEIERITKTINEILRDNTLVSVANSANRELAWVQALLKRDNISQTDMQTAYQIVALWQDISTIDTERSLITKEDKETREFQAEDEDGNLLYKADGSPRIIQDIPQSVKNIIAVDNLARDLEKELDAQTKNLLQQSIEDRFGVKMTVEKIFAKIKDITKLSLYTRDASNSGNILVDLMSNIRRMATRKANEETKRMQEKREKAFAKVQNSPLFRSLGKDKFMELLWQLDAEGKATGGLINRYSEAYWKKRRQFSKDLRSGNPKKAKAAMEWYTQTHEYVNYFETAEEKQAEIERLSEEFGKERAVELVEEMGEIFKDYRLRKENKFEEIDDTEFIGTVEQQELEKEFQKELWLKKNDPARILSRIKEGSSARNERTGEYIKNNFDYVKAVPKKKDTEWYDTAFEKIEADPLALEYYNYVRETMQANYAQYDKALLEDKGLHSGFIPQLQKNMFKEARKNGAIGLWKYAGEEVKKLTHIKTQSEVANHLDAGSGKIMETLDVRFLAPTRNYIKDGRVINTSDVITDIDAILTDFITATTQYKHLKQVEPEFLMVREQANKLKGISKTPSDVASVNTKGENLADETDLKNLKELIQYEYDLFYGKAKQKAEKASSKKKLTKEEKKIEEELNGELDKVREELKDPDLTEEKEQKLLKQEAGLERTISDLGHNFSHTRTIKSILRWWQLVTQGWNFNSSIIEALYGMMSNRINAAGGKDYTAKQIRRGMALAMKAVSAGERSALGRKFHVLLDRYQVLGEYMDMEAHKNDKNNNFLKKNIGPYSTQRAADKISKGSAMIAMLMNTNLEGNPIQEGEISLWEAYDEHGQIKEKYATPEIVARWTPETIEGKTNAFWRLQDHITQVTARNHGRYESDAQIKLVNSAYGMMFLQFRRWMVEGMNVRFEQERFDSRLGRNVKGRYITYRDLYNQKGFAGTAATMFKATSRMLMFSPITEEEFKEMDITSETDMENVQKNAAGLIGVISIYMLALLVRAGFKDDDDDSSTMAFTVKFLLNQGGRLQDDLTMYANPVTAADFLKNPVPAMRLVEKIKDWSENVVGYVIDDKHPFNFNKDEEYVADYEKGDFKGQSKILIKTGELLPGTSAWIRIYRTGKKVYD